jgi:ABC-type uncharacterized transport system substrate-binding protein
MRFWLVCIALLLAPACAKTPPILSPAAQQAYKSHEVQKDIDLLRDIAQDANAQVPPVLSTATTRKIIDWHTAVTRIMLAAGDGWQVTVATSLDEVVKNLPANEQQLIAPYVSLIKTILNEVTR